MARLGEREVVEQGAIAADGLSPDPRGSGLDVVQADRRHVLNAPSPAATASLAIAELVADRLDGR